MGQEVQTNKSPRKEVGDLSKAPTRIRRKPYTKPNPANDHNTISICSQEKKEGARIGRQVRSAT